jgi:hypothetical protein
MYTIVFFRLSSQRLHLEVDVTTGHFLAHVFLISSGSSLSTRAKLLNRAASAAKSLLNWAP